MPHSAAQLRAEQRERALEQRSMRRRVHPAARARRMRQRNRERPPAGVLAPRARDRSVGRAARAARKRSIASFPTGMSSAGLTDLELGIRAMAPHASCSARDGTRSPRPVGLGPG